MTSEQPVEDEDPLFEGFGEDDGSQIISRPRLLEDDWVPEENKIVGRNGEIENVVQEVGPVVNGNAPNSLMIYGKTGSGKSLVARHIMDRTEKEASRRDTSLSTAYVDCAQARGNTDVVQKIASTVNFATSGINVPRRGLSADEYYDRLWEILNKGYDAALITLDEIDQLKDDRILLILSRARESQKINIPIGIIAISNKITYRENMDERVKSSLGQNEMVFPPYDATQLIEILESRSDAFNDGVLEDDVIPKAAALAAKEHGDARKAIRLLRYAGQFAEKRNYNSVQVEHLESAKEDAEADRLNDLISNLPSHSKYVLLAIANLSKDGDDWHKTTEIYSKFEDVCEAHGVERAHIDTVRDQLSELNFLEITESQYNHGGQGKGSYKQHRLLWDTAIIFKLI